MTLRAEAAVFTPAADLKANANLTDDACSTVAPSPELSAQCDTPMLSPFWGYEEMTPEMMAYAAAWGGYMPEFTLPDLQPGMDANEMGSYGRPRANTEPAYMGGDFTLSGVEGLTESLAGLLAKKLPPADGESQESTSAEEFFLPPPGLAPPPGLEAPPGLELEEVEAPPGLEATTVAQLHMRLKKRERAGTWPNGEKTAKTSPLPVGTTTAMLRNIPNKYTQVGLIERLNENGFCGQLDFIYLPIDFKNKCNVGYAFVNFRTAEACERFAIAYHHSNSRDMLPGYNSKKVCEVSAARFQGCEENVRRLQTSAVMSELVSNPEWLPKLFDEEGNDVDFPLADMSKEAAAMNRSARGRLQRRK